LKSFSTVYDVELLSNLDFTGSSFIRPLGADSISSCVSFRGRFDGKGHTIRKLILDGGYGSTGLLCDVKNAVIKNLVFDKTCEFAGYYIGAVSPYFSGDVVVNKVVVNAVMKPGYYGGGFLGQTNSNSASGVSIAFEGCEFGGSVVSKNDFTYFGCFVGNTDKCSGCKLLFEKNRNRGVLSSKSCGYFGGFIGLLYGNSNAAEFKNNVNQLYAEVKPPSPGKTDIINSGFVATTYGDGQSLIMEDNINDGTIIVTAVGFAFAGGFLGHLGYGKNGVLTLKNNTNYGDIAMSTDTEEESPIQVGGFVGGASSSTNTAITLKSNSNFGWLNFTGEDYATFHVGGFLGYLSVDTSAETPVKVVDNVNYGSFSFDAAIKQESSMTSVGGLIGSVSDSHITLENNTNRGSIEGRLDNGDFDCGGLIGFFCPLANPVIRLNTNYGNIKLERKSIREPDVAGLFGDYIGRRDAVVIDSENFGDVSCTTNHKSARVCGLLCGSNSINIENCVNKGNVEGTNAYGITNQCEKCNNIVSMGVIKGNGTYVKQFWNYGESVSKLYGMHDNCINCNNGVTPFELNDGYYYTLGDSPIRVDALLNNEAESKHYHYWDINLDLALPDIVHVRIEDPVNFDKDTFGGNPLQKCNVPAEVFRKYHLFEKGSTTKEYTPVTTVNRNVVLVPLYGVTINGGKNGTYPAGASGRTKLGDCGIPNEIFECHLFEAGSEPSTSDEYKKESVVDRSLDLVTYYRVMVNGGKNGTFFVETGSKTKLGNCGIPGEVFESHLYEVGSDPSTSDEYTRYTVIDKNLDLVTYCKVTVEEEEADEKKYYVETDSDVESVGQLKTYMEDEDYAVGDSDNNNVLTVQSTVTGDMTIIVIKRNVVVFDIDESASFNVEDVSLTAIAAIIDSLTGIARTSILVELETDEQGNVVRVVAIMNDIEKCRATAEAVNNDVNCYSYNILCHSHAQVLEPSSSHSSSYSSSHSSGHSSTHSSTHSSNGSSGNDSNVDSSVPYLSLSPRYYLHFVSMLLLLLVLV